ncbi:MAG: DUF2116 family Zn-ribbon domain-containing protein [Nitrospira sp. CR1.3]|nr:DUF2116 family Zn-ribbon domain-containing protein [Nitrospira sp. CR1.3]
MPKVPPIPTPDRSRARVRTPFPEGACPVCGAPLRSTQTVCSAKCRAARSRDRRVGEQAERDAQVRLLLRTAREALDDALPLLTDHGARQEDEER